MNQRLYRHAWWVGYDLLYAKCDEVIVQHCPICGDEMDVRRGVFGPTSLGEAWAKKGNLHDTFTCPNAYLDWHVRAIRLRQEANETASQKVRALIEEELEDLVRTRPCASDLERGEST